MLVISELDIWRAANLLIHHHGADADLFAAQRADLMLDRGDREGQLRVRCGSSGALPPKLVLTPDR